MSEIINVCIDAAKVAGEFLRTNFGKTIDNIEKKSDQSLATNLDRAAEAIIVDQIKQKFPAHGIIGEERGQDGADREYIWIIDPLDGTHNYIRRIPVFGVSIGVVHRDNFVAGVIYLPFGDELFAAETGNGAYKNNQKIRVSQKTNLQDCMVAFDSDIRINPELKLETLGATAAKSFNIRMFGATSRQLTYLSEGKLDAIIEFNDHPWDFTAGACILEESGGRITNLQGGKLTYRHRGYLASNGLVHPQILELVGGK